MAHFAQLDNNNVVLQVIVVDNEDCKDSDGNESEAVGIAFCQSLLGPDTKWVQTSYNNNIRHQYAGIGMTYDENNDVFISRQPVPSWNLNTDTWEWEPPLPIPDDGGFHEDTNTFIAYFWNEETISWDKEETVLKGQ
jgi:hypothetical protein